MYQLRISKFFHKLLALQLAWKMINLSNKLEMFAVSVVMYKLVLAREINVMTQNFIKQ